MNTHPSFARDWPALAAIGLFVFLVACGARFLELPKWDNPSLAFGDAYIMATHDSYFWLAGAEGFGAAADAPMARFAAILARLTGLPSAKVCFFAPAFFAGLVGVATLLFAWSLGALEAGICAGALAAIFPGFYFRSRFGYYDTDSVTLLFPLLIAWFLAVWTSRRLEPKRWWPPPMLRRLSAAQTPAPAPSFTTGCALMMTAGLAARFCNAWHNDIENFTKLSIVLAVFLILTCGARDRQRESLWALGLFGLCSVLGWPGLALAAVLLGASLVADKRAPRCFQIQAQALRAATWPLAVLFAILAYSGGFVGPVWQHAERQIYKYIKPTAQQAPDLDNLAPKRLRDKATPSASTLPKKMRPPSSIPYPGPIQSVQEAQNLDTARALAHIHPSAWVAVAGLAGLGLLILVRPEALFLAPLALLWMLSPLLGGRLTMFGGPPLFLGLCVPFCWAGRLFFGHKAWRQPVLAGLQTLAALLLAAPLAFTYPRLELTPALSQAHAVALAQLRELAPDDALVWTWWDWGYATHFFSRLETFADGGRNLGELLYPLGLALTTTSPKLANQLIKFCAVNDYAPWEVWHSQTPAQVSTFLESLDTVSYDYKPDHKIFLVVSLEQLRVMPWISYYGAWDMAKRKGTHARVAPQTAKAVVDIEKGGIFYPETKTELVLATVDRIENAGAANNPEIGNARLHHYAYKRAYGLHLISVPATNDSYLLDDLAYNALAIQLLLHDPLLPEVRPYFKLVYEVYPYVRIYEVL